MNNKVPVYVRIDENIRNLATEYVHQCKIANIELTNTRNKLIEEAIREFIRRNPV